MIRMMELIQNKIKRYLGALYFLLGEVTGLAINSFEVIHFIFSPIIFKMILKTKLKEYTKFNVEDIFAFD